MAIRKIDNYLSENQGAQFTELNIQDESEGKYVKGNKILNKFWVRHLKTTLSLKESTGEIGNYLYRFCHLLEATNFWTNQKSQKVFWYSWK